MMNILVNNVQVVFKLVMLMMFSIMLPQFFTNKMMMSMIVWSMSTINSSQMNISIFVDSMSVMFSWSVIFISANIMMFSQFYMMTEKFKSRFNQLISVFIISMCLFIYSGDLIFALLGWDGLGVTSFMLVIYHQNQKSCGGGMVTLLMNRVGDVMIMLSLASILSNSSWSMSHSTWTTMTPQFIMMVLLGSMTKSAQLPFSVWLPEAMAAPTPVSALVHSSTLVTAGIFLMIRLNKLMMYNNYHTIMMYVSSLTMLGGGMWGAISKDTKKIVAFSTLSHLGIMMLTLSVGMVNLTFLHLLMHAMFKALLFVCVGTDIIIKSHKQNHTKNMSYSYLDSLSKAKQISLLSMNALPFLSGYISKDSIIEMTQTQEKFEMALIMWGGSSFTVMYSLRLWSLTSSEIALNQTNSNFMALKNNNSMIMSYLSLSVMSIVMGMLLIQMILVNSYMCSWTEHIFILMIVVCGTTIFWLSPTKSNFTNHFLSSLLLQKEISKKFTSQTLTSSKIVNNLVESGISQWMLIYLTFKSTKIMSQLVIKQQSMSPTNTLLLMSMMYLSLLSLI